MIKKIDESADRRIAELEEQVAYLERELLGTQEMLGFVLAEIDEPVVVRKESLKRGLGEVQIRIDDDVERDLFTFQLVPYES